jgi:peptidoglycan/LPS O-acetylase OafA/YrhL
LRIFPLYYLAVACVFLVLPKVAMTHPSRGLYAAPVPFGDQIWFWLNISNVRTAFTPMLVPLLTNFWSLAIEEQFYLFWPAIIRRFSSATVVRICVIGFFLPLVVRCLPHPAFGTFNFYYRLTPFHMEGLLAGAGLAFVQAKHQLFRFRSWYIASLVASAVGILAAGQWPDARILHEAIPTFFSAGSAGLIGLCLLGNQNSLGLARVFSSKPLRLFGDCSYFIYIFHTWFGLWVTVMLAPLYSRSEFFRGKHRQVLIEALVTLVCVLGAAVLSRVFFEGPFLRLKRYFPYGVAPAGRGGRAGRANPTESVPTEA